MMEITYDVALKNKGPKEAVSTQRVKKTAPKAEEAKLIRLIAMLGFFPFIV